MKIVLIIVGVLGLILFLRKLVGISNIIKKYGPIKLYLRTIIQEIYDDYPLTNVLIENDGRLKLKSQSVQNIIETDFIYMKDHLQVCLTFDLGERVKTFNVPYNREFIKKELEKNIQDYLSPEY